MKSIQTKFKWTGSLLALVLIILVALGCEEFGSRAKGRIVEKQCSPSAGLVNGEMDYGVEVKLRIKNVGDTGLIKVTPAISTSEGEWQRSQKLTFKAGEEKTLTYFFHEPTINVTNVQCKIGIFPEE